MSNRAERRAGKARRAERAGKEPGKAGSARTTSAARAPGQTVCLCMIVKDEASVIRRCLDSVRALITHWVIVDTGSTDGTQEIVRAHLRDLPGELVERPWRDFAHNRSEALALARPHGDYSLIIDADDVLVVPAGFRLPALAADSYSVDVAFDTTVLSRPQLVRAALPWRYEGVLHEYLVCEAARTSAHLPLTMRMHADGARRRDPETYKRDAEVLARALAEEADPFKRARYTFYLAQSYRDSGQDEKALPLYLERAGMGFWDQEAYWSLLCAGRISAALGHPPEDALALYRRAAALCPERAEALYSAARLCRDLRRFPEGQAFARRAADKRKAPGGLFVETWIHDWGALDELAVNAYWAGDYRTCAEASREVLAGGRLPESQRERLSRNIALAREAEAARGRAPAASPSAVPPTADPAREQKPASGAAPGRATVCLCMIVKDEAPVIRRCLDSVRPLIDRWIIVDTGSTDGTQGIVRDHFRDIPGELVERPWKDFAHNRSEALALARPHGDYSLIIDADDSLDVPPGYRLPDLDADSYLIDIHFGGSRYNRHQLVKASLGWRYEGVIHEYLVCERASTVGHLPIVMHIHQDGARRRDPGTYKRDVAVLERAVAEETDPFKLSRYTFYLAQSYRDSGEPAKALPLYLRRAGMGFWEQEAYVSLLNAGRLSEALGRPPAEAEDAYRRAIALCPARAEAFHAAARLLRGQRRFSEGCELARPAIDLEPPHLGLFLEAWIYDYGMLDEFAVNAFWADRPRDSLDAALRALKRGKVPPDQVGHFLDNMRSALDRLPEEAPRRSEPDRGAAVVPSTSDGPPRADVRPEARELAGAAQHPPPIPPSDLDATASRTLPRHAAERLEGEVASAARPNQMSSKPSPSAPPVHRSGLAESLALARHAIVVADIGAAFFGEQQLYQPLIDMGIGRLVCFEPDETQVATLERHLGEQGRVFPFALGDGRSHTLHIAPGGMTSLLEPDQDAYGLYTLFAAAPYSPVARSITTATLETRRLDDLDDVPPIDMLKIDIQGSELMVLQNATRKLATCAVIQVEVPFVPLYKGMPTFGDIDAELRRQGFMVHGFANLKRLPVHPYGSDAPLNGINQLVDLDMVYVRDLKRMDRISDQILRKTALIADTCYQSFDVAQRCIVELVRRRSIPSNVELDYAARRAGGHRIGNIHMTPAVQPA